MRWLTLLVLMACGRPAPRPPGLPSVPVLDEAAPVQHRRLFTLRGVAADEVVVRVFTDSACAGPVYLQTTGAALREGVKVELVPGVENVFSANAVSARGATSGCSSPLRLRYVEAIRPGRPSVETRPSSPSTATHFAVVGATESFARVRLYEGTCSTSPLAELSAAEFFEPGFPVDVPVNGSRFLALDAVNEDLTSACQTLVLSNDDVPPRFGVRLASPSPSPQQEAYVQFTGDLERIRVYAYPGCIGELTSCFGCWYTQLYFPRGATTSFSARNTDAAGNSVCVEGDRPWVHDPSLPEEEAVVLLEGWPVLGQVPAGRSRIEVFASSDCSGQAVKEPYAIELISRGLDLEAPAGFITARSWRQDGGLDPCSNPVYWP